MNKGDKEIAKLMMEGNQKGVLEITAELNQYEGDDEEILSLAKRLLETEEHNSYRLFFFLIDFSSFFVYNYEL